MYSVCAQERLHNLLQHQASSKAAESIKPRWTTKDKNLRNYCSIGSSYHSEPWDGWWDTSNKISLLSFTRGVLAYCWVSPWVLLYNSRRNFHMEISIFNDHYLYLGRSHVIRPSCSLDCRHRFAFQIGHSIIDILSSGWNRFLTGDKNSWGKLWAKKSNDNLCFGGIISWARLCDWASGGIFGIFVLSSVG
jgi:hypothetical protein